jgi:glyoxylase-like metal-dependent hydrolase (beta-lactamase superfamily II)
MIAATGRRLESIVITHIHPDHLLGLPVLLDRFPEARAYAQADVQAVIAQVAAPMHAEIAGSAPAGVFADRVVVPEVLGADHLMLEGERIEILPPMAGDTALITPVHIPGLDTLIATDIAYIDTHLWMEEVALTDGIGAWRASVAALRGIGAGTVLPGHRKAGGPSDATVLDATLAYLDHWETARAASGNAEEFRARLMAGTEDLGFAFAIDRGVPAAFPG